MAINQRLIEFLAKAAEATKVGEASKTFQVKHPQSTAKPSSGMSAIHGNKPSKNNQSPHRLGRKFGG